VVENKNRVDGRFGDEFARVAVDDEHPRLLAGATVGDLDWTLREQAQRLQSDSTSGGSTMTTCSSVTLQS
jgi:hypothetical protein